MKNISTKATQFSIGMDLGDKRSRFCLMNEEETIVSEGWVTTTKPAMSRRFSSLPRARVVIEASTHSAWVSRVLQECGHEAVVANPREVGRKYLSKTKKNDKSDARTLAHLGLVSEFFLSPIKHRSLSAQVDLSQIRCRDALIKSRTGLINHARTIVKGVGERLPKCAAHVFSERVLPHIPCELKEALVPIVELVGTITAEIKEYDKKIEVLSQKYPETQLLRQIPGVGALTSLAFILTLEDPKRFPKSRQVGAFVGLVPRQHDTGESSPQLRITKAGNDYLRRLLVTSSQYILGHYGKDCDLKRHGERISLKGGKAAKKRAVVAVARKLAVLLHLLWRTAQVYEPFHSPTQRKKAS